MLAFLTYLESGRHNSAATRNCRLVAIHRFFAYVADHPHGIWVNAVAPQLLDTPVNRATFPAEVMAHAVAPEAIADVIAFLVSDAAAPVSGAILPAYGA